MLIGYLVFLVAFRRLDSGTVSGTWATALRRLWLSRSRMGKRRRAATIASPSRVYAFSEPRRLFQLGL